MGNVPFIRWGALFSHKKWFEFSHYTFPIIQSKFGLKLSWNICSFEKFDGNVFWLSIINIYIIIYIEENLTQWIYVM
jgi:hypothetical protein